MPGARLELAQGFNSPTDFKSGAGVHSPLFRSEISSRSYDEFLIFQNTAKTPKCPKSVQQFTARQPILPHFQTSDPILFLKQAVVWAFVYTKSLPPSSLSISSHVTP